MKRLGLAAVGAALLVGLAAPPAVAAPVGHWQSPKCTTVQGDGAITYTRDDGRTLTPTSATPRPVQYVFGMVTLPGNQLLAVDSRGALQSSADAGCTWTPVGGVTGLDVPRLTAGRGNEAYVWDQNGPGLYRVDGARVTPLPPVTDTNESVRALAADPYFPGHLRAVLGDGTVRDSFDGGRSFRTTAQPVHANLFVYSASIDPLNPNHIVLGTSSEGVYTTWLGGRHWTQSSLAKRVNGFTVTISPANPFVVWAQGIDLAEHDAHVPSEGRHIYRSTDGGHTFRVAVDHVPGKVTLVNGALLAPSPVDANVVYFVFGTSFAAYGTDLFRYDARHDRLSLQHNKNDGIATIAFNPRDPKVMYLGLSVEP